MTIKAMINVTDAAAVGVGAGTVLPAVMEALPDIVLVLSAVWLVIRTAEWLWRVFEWARVAVWKRPPR